MTLRFIAGLSVTRRRQILTASDHKAASSILCTRPTHRYLMSARFSYRTAELVGKSTSALDVHVDFPKLKHPGPPPRVKPPPVRVVKPYVNSSPFPASSLDLSIEKKKNIPLLVRRFFYGRQNTPVSQLGFESDRCIRIDGSRRSKERNVRGRRLEKNVV